MAPRSVASMETFDNVSDSQLWQQDSNLSELPKTIPKIVKHFSPLWPPVLGLAFGRAGLIVACYGGYKNTDEGLFTDGAMLINLVFAAVILLVLSRKNAYIHKHLGNSLVRVAIAVEAITVLALNIGTAQGAFSQELRLAICVLCTFAGSWCIYYWLRRARGSGTATATVFVFTALILSEIELYITTLIPVEAAGVLAAALALVQYPCILWARTQAQPYDIMSPVRPTDFFTAAKNIVQSKLFLMVIAVGVGFLAIAIGFLRGYPDGASIPFMPETRLLYGLLTIALCIVFIVAVLRHVKYTMTIYMFVTMEFLACVALVCYAAFPERLDIGAAFTTTTNALMVGYTWYIIIAFMSYGRRDPYYYALGGWIVWLGARALARMALYFSSPMLESDMLVNALIGALLVISAEVFFIQIFRVLSVGETAPAKERGQTCEHCELSMRTAIMQNVSTAGAMASQPAWLSGAALREGNPGSIASSDTAASPVTQPEKTKESRIMRIMGLDEGESMSDIRQKAMRHNAEEMGKQFMLSEREVDVLTLYALGWTQKRVAEELYISPGTAHAHIKRIYAKTDMHSRQEILDYMSQYTS